MEKFAASDFHFGGGGGRERRAKTISLGLGVRWLKAGAASERPATAFHIREHFRIGRNSNICFAIEIRRQIASIF